MYAEAVNELENGVTGANGQSAINAFKMVRNRAFNAADRAEKVDQYVTAAGASKEEFFKAIMNERKWEFGGENMRWKDLVRWNKYSEVVYESFKDYFILGNYAKANFLPGYEKFQNFPFEMFYRRVTNPNNIDLYANTTLQVLDFYNLYNNATNPGTTSGYNLSATFYDWKGSDDSEFPTAQCLYSFRGYVREGENANYETLDPNSLPPVRYILPYPNKVLQMAPGFYKNYYGYN
ncbi:MAG: RagB/SusD family nutrient uptake outer membrane protein [Paludibacter sp.]